MDQILNLELQIKGWGVDLDPARRPAYPKEKIPPDGTGAHWKNPEQQVPTVKILKFIEHLHMTPVFGTTCPPRGLSGRVREFAYTYSEGRPLHWMLLLAADRLDVVEGIGRDLARGHIPNFFAEKGLRAEMKYNPAAFQKRMLIWGLVAGAVLGGISMRWRKKVQISA